MAVIALPNLALHAETIHENLNDHASLCAFQGDEDTARQIDPHLENLDLVISLTKDVSTIEEVTQKFDLGLLPDAPRTDRQKSLIYITFLSAKIVMATEVISVALVAGDFFDNEALTDAAKELSAEMDTAVSVRRTLSREAREAGASLRDILSAMSGEPGLIASYL